MSPDQVQALREEYAYDNNEDNNEMAPEDAGRWAARIPHLLDALDSAQRTGEEAQWSCPDCAFTFDAGHTDEPNGGYSCPLCKLVKAEARLAALAEAGRRVVVWGKEVIASGDRLAVRVGVEPARNSPVLDAFSKLLEET